PMHFTTWFAVWLTVVACEPLARRLSEPAIDLHLDLIGESLNQQLLAHACRRCSAVQLLPPLAQLAEIEAVERLDLCSEVLLPRHDRVLVNRKRGSGACPCRPSC